MDSAQKFEAFRWNGIEFFPVGYDGEWGSMRKVKRK